MDTEERPAVGAALTTRPCRCCGRRLWQFVILEPFVAWAMCPPCDLKGETDDD